MLAAIDGRLADLVAEITVLEAASAALDGPRSDGRAPATPRPQARVLARHAAAARRHSPPRRRPAPLTRPHQSSPRAMT